MAGSIGGGKGHGKRYSDNSEINVTPFVDVMLVLLIIFMVAAPLASVSVKLDLPPAAAKATPNPPKPIYISIQRGGDIYIGDFKSDIDDVGPNLKKQVGKRNPGKERIFIRVDKKTRYRDFMEVMNKLQDNGFYSVALIGTDANK